MGVHTILSTFLDNLKFFMLKYWGNNTEEKLFSQQTFTEYLLYVKHSEEKGNT